MSRHVPSILTQNAQKNNSRRSRLFDSRAYTRLLNRHEDGRQSPPDSLSIKMKLPSQKEFAATRPSLASQQTGSLKGKKQRGMFKATHLERQSESLEEWFQRIMHTRKLSPLDLCDLFSYRDARRNSFVSLDHVFEVLFYLDPEPVDPVTEEMEDFLYEFATEQGGKIMVNIREALRSLNIWQTRASSTHMSYMSEAANLQSKNRKFLGMVSNLQGANLRPSRQLNCVTSIKSIEKRTRLPQSQVNVKLRDEISSVKDITIESENSLVKCGKEPSLGLQIVNDHAHELIEIASKLEFTGVQHLEHLLIQGDTDSTGFVSIKELCRLLMDQFELNICETRLIEMCLGMNFDSIAQLDYKEFVNVLMDILIYALPNIRDSEKKNSLLRLDEYLLGGFSPKREKTRRVFDALCSKYDFQGDQCISVADFVRVFREELVEHHALKLPFPLEKHEIIQLARPFIRCHTGDLSLGDYIAYPELLNAIFEPLPTAVSNDSKHFQRAFDRAFWRKIYMALCRGNGRLNKKVQAQIETILAKLDPNLTFTISSEQFRRIFCRHIGTVDMEVLTTALAMPNDDAFGSRLRYDVLLNLIFGSPELNDKKFYKNIRSKLLRKPERAESFVNEISRFSHELSLQDFHDTLVAQMDKNSLTLVEMLFLFASVASGQIHVGALKNILRNEIRHHQK